MNGNKLDSFILANAPPRVLYIPEYITESEEEYLLSEVYKTPKPRWTQLSNRRLQNWGGVPHAKGMIAEKIPQWLDSYVKRVGSTGVFGDVQPNHVLVNEYQPGQGIMPHLDGPLFYPTITTISLGSHTVLKLYDNTEQKTTELLSLWVERRSLLILQEDLYHKYLHGIEEVTSDTVTSDTVTSDTVTSDTVTLGDNNIVNLSQCKSETVCPGESYQRGTRVSLTIRHVPKTTKFGLKLGK